MINQLIFLIIFLASVNNIDEQSLSLKRQELIRNATVKVLVEGTDKFGTGFIINENGDILTALHVLAAALILPSNGGQIVETRKIIIEMRDGTRIIYRLEDKFRTKGAEHAILYDYCLLVPDQVIPKIQNFLKLGRFEDISEGDQAYTCGYPIPGTQQVITSGGLIEKQLTGSELLIFNMRTFQGNSGGAIVKLGKTISEDVVVGMSSYIISQSQDKSKDGLCVGVSINYFHDR